MNPAATAFDFRRQPKELQDRVLQVLDTCRTTSLSVRCEMHGNDFAIIIAPGYGAASYWLERLTQPVPTAALPRT